MTTTADKKSPTPPRSKATACDLVTVFKTYSRWPPTGVWGDPIQTPYGKAHGYTALHSRGRLFRLGGRGEHGGIHVRALRIRLRAELYRTLKERASSVHSSSYIQGQTMQTRAHNIALREALQHKGTSQHSSKDGKEESKSTLPGKGLPTEGPRREQAGAQGDSHWKGLAHRRVQNRASSSSWV